ncbi:arylamine N-acetyltransferase, pineal gland isozyme NAT-10-like isoform 1-T4 [Discoglossus pictus]
MDLNGYLHRIGIKAPSPPSLSALQEMHLQHLRSVPFESLSIHCGEKIILDQALLYDKIVERRRGGFCCENNGLFLWVLQQSGYQPRILSANVRNKITGVYGPAYDHMLLSVELEGRRWLCDVGFGFGFIRPLPLKAGWEEEQENGVFRLRVDGEQWFMERKEDEGSICLYKFTLEEKRFEDFQQMCDYHQTSPSSIFFCKSFCSIQLPNGRLTYMGRRLINTKFTPGGGSVKTTQDLTDEEIPDLLRDKFGIVLSGKLVVKDDD